MVQPLSTILDKFRANREANLYKLGHNGQVCYLQAILNDAFDTSLRRIRIGDTERMNWTFIYPDASDHPLWLETVQVASEAFTSDEGTDFAVVVPSEISQDLKPQMISLVNYYKLAGKRYSIISLP
ncbi:MAG TPA: hypothetical protein DD458_03410 [Prolixibacteraceae bacterium]|nr:hypothetical protein [Prolixibacteraceae bacterium]HCU64024.1 hypothetical protein [Prolixibacteraceae bacterium]